MTAVENHVARRQTHGIGESRISAKLHVVTLALLFSCTLQSQQPAYRLLRTKIVGRDVVSFGFAAFALPCTPTVLPINGRRSQIKNDFNHAKELVPVAMVV